MTGPNGTDVIGAAKPESDDDEEFKAEAEAEKPAANNKATSKAALAFKPRAVKRPAPKAVQRPPAAAAAKPPAVAAGSTGDSNASAAGHAD